MSLTPTEQYLQNMLYDLAAGNQQSAQQQLHNYIVAKSDLILSNRNQSLRPSVGTFNGKINPDLANTINKSRGK